MSTLDEILSRLGGQRVLCVGDLILDEFVYGDVSRISPEAATPVLAVRRRETQIGGAGNVARNVASLGGHCIFVGVVGSDEAGRALSAALAAEAGIATHLVVDASRPTTHKIRFVSEHHSTHLLRADHEVARPVAGDIEEAVVAHAVGALGDADGVVLSDYAKGVLTPRVIRALIAAARERGIPVVVDPKGADFSVYRGATLITPNHKELGEATRRAVDGHEAVEAAAAELARMVESEAVRVTRSEEGMSRWPGHAPPVHIPGYRVRVRDVSGAGDTVAATLATLLAMGVGFEPAMRAANAAAAVAVGKRGTATVSAAELRARLQHSGAPRAESKIAADAHRLAETLAEWRREGLRIGFTNGCFDLLHPGHVKLLAEARGACDRLIVGLNSDRSVQGLKGPGRPVQAQGARAEVLAALQSVDLVVVFDEPTPLRLIGEVRPDVLVKGADYRIEDVVGRDVVEAAGGEVRLVALSPGHSTTKLVDDTRKLAAE